MNKWASDALMEADFFKTKKRGGYVDDIELFFFEIKKVGLTEFNRTMKTDFSAKPEKSCQ